MTMRRHSPDLQPCPDRGDRIFAWIVLAVCLLSFAITALAMYGRDEPAPHHWPWLVFLACMAGQALRDLLRARRVHQK